MSEAEWYYYLEKDKQQHGPVSSQELARLAGTGELKTTDKVWKDGMGDWIPASRVKGLPFTTTPGGALSGSNVTAVRETSPAPVTGSGMATPSSSPVGFKFPDLDFHYFISTKVIRILWILELIFVGLSLVFSMMYLLYMLVSRGPDLVILIMLIVTPILHAFGLLLVRIWLELIIVFFRMAEHLKEMKDKVSMV